MPDTYVILFFVVLAAWVATWIVPAGQFATHQITYDAGGVETTRTVLTPGTFTLAQDENGQPYRIRVPLFASGDGIGLFNYAFDGLTSGSRWGGSVGVAAFILIIGGAFGIIMRTGALEDGMVAVIERTKGREILFIPVIFTLFAAGGATFGMGEEVIAFAMIIVPLTVALGYNALTGLMVTYLASQIGFATSWMNPFSVAVAQGLAGVPVLSGAGFRFLMWLSFVVVGIAMTMWYASRIKRDPARSLSADADTYFREDVAREGTRRAFTIGHWLVIGAFFAGIVWIIWGVTFAGYFIPEIASQFFTMGIVIGAIGAAFRLNGMGVNDIARGFKQGLADMAPSAAVVGMARGIMLILGSDDPAVPSVLNTLLNSAGVVLTDMPQMLAAWFMLVLQSVFNFFIVSGSGQAALTMPLMGPLADLAGLTRQVAVLAFQLGDGLTNTLVPTSASLMGVLGVARVDWLTWIRHIWPFALVIFALASAWLLYAVASGLT